MAIRVEAPHRGHRITRRQFLTVFAAAAGTAGFAAAGLNRLANSPTEIENQKPATAAPKLESDGPILASTSTSTLEPSPTLSPTKTPEPTSTPEAERVYWSADAISQKQEALKNQPEISIADTWTSKGAKAEDMRTYNNHTGIIFDGFQSGSTFDAPIGGKVTTVAANIGTGWKTHTVMVMVGNNEIQFEFDWDDEILVKQKQDITPGMPMSKLSGHSLPTGASFSRNGQIAMFDNRTNNLSTQKNLLKDENGNTIALGSSK